MKATRNVAFPLIIVAVFAVAEFTVLPAPHPYYALNPIRHLEAYLPASIANDAAYSRYKWTGLIYAALKNRSFEVGCASVKNSVSPTISRWGKEVCTGEDSVKLSMSAYPADFEPTGHAWPEPMRSPELETILIRTVQSDDIDRAVSNIHKTMQSYGFTLSFGSKHIYSAENDRSHSDYFGVEKGDTQVSLYYVSVSSLISKPPHIRRVTVNILKRRKSFLIRAEISRSKWKTNEFIIEGVNESDLWVSPNSYPVRTNFPANVTR